MAILWLFKLGFFPWFLITLLLLGSGTSGMRMPISTSTPPVGAMPINQSSTLGICFQVVKGGGGFECNTQLQIINLNFLSSKPYEINAIWLKKMRRFHF